MLDVLVVMLAAIELPPEEYDHEPVARYAVLHVEPSRINEICRTPRRSSTTLLGCADLGVNLIYVRDDLSPAALERVLRHEKAHLNGWTHRKKTLFDRFFGSEARR